MKPPGSGDGFEEDFSDLIELNGYKVARIVSSGDGGLEMIANKTDEVGHKVTFFIHCKRADSPIDEAEVERIAKSLERDPGGICVVVSPSTGFARSVVDLAQRRGVRLWGPEEIERLRRNVAEKRSIRQRGTVGRSDLWERGKKRRRNAKLAALLIILSIAIIYAKFYGSGTEILQKPPTDLEDLADRDLWDVREVYSSWASMVREVVRGSSERISKGLSGMTEGLTLFRPKDEGYMRISRYSSLVQGLAAC